MMNRFRKGDLIRLIDNSGEDKGFATYMELHPPGFLPSGGDHYDGFWHFSIIDTRGELRYLSTHNWTPIPADLDSCNP